MGLGRRLLLFSYTAAILWGCHSVVVPPRASFSPNREFFPLQPGTLWIYEVQDFKGQVDLKRVIVRGSHYLKTQNTSGVIVEESGGNSDELLLDVSWHPVAYYRRGEFLYRFSGLSYVEAELREFRLGQAEEKVLPEDLSAHPEWESDFEVFHVGQGIGYAVRSVSTVSESLDTVTVRSGTFQNCLRVETRAVSGSLPHRAEEPQVLFRYTDWYAPGIGLVKSVTEVPPTPQPVNTVELVSFRSGRSAD